MKVTFSSNAWEDYVEWQHVDSRMVRRINAVIKDIQRAPFEGVGKPEPLRHGLSGYWSRRITDEHRLVYRVEDGSVCIAQLRYHY